MTYERREPMTEGSAELVPYLASCGVTHGQLSVLLAHLEVAMTTEIEGDRAADDGLFTDLADLSADLHHAWYLIFERAARPPETVPLPEFICICACHRPPFGESVKVPCRGCSPAHAAALAAKAADVIEDAVQRGVIPG